ncbi:MAG: Gfo/Idh/MocA family oxidoreductase [Clostridiales bacterium]|nr:Gfo/Idh/MocA family oxidoreductase [Clostridiales bacterium]
MDGTMGVGLIGLGAISDAHIRALTALPGVSIAAVCDVDGERLARASQATGGRPYADWRALLTDPSVQAVHILTPHYLHAPMAIEALGRGKHALTEKPMASTLSDARALIAAADQYGCTLGVVFQNRYNRAAIQAREIVQSGEMGRLTGAMAQVCWRREGPYYAGSPWRGSLLTEGAGALINQAIHTLDLLSYIGGPIASVRGAVFAAALQGLIEVEDNAAAVATYAAGGRAVIHITNNYAFDRPVTLEFAMEHGAIRLEGERLYRVGTDGAELVASGDRPVVADKAYWGSGHAALIAGFYAAIGEGKPFWLNGREGFAALNLALSIVRSSSERRTVALEPAP